MSSMRSGLERGKRTGAVIATQAVTRKDDGFEDEDAMFDAVASPDPSKASTSSKKKSTDVVSKRSSRLVRFSLESKAAEDNEASAAQPTKQVAAQSAARKMITEPRESLSPSDISRASTAPPLPKQPEEDEPEQELVTQPEDSQRDVDDTDFPTQDDDEEGDDLIPPAPPESPEEDDRNENIPQDDDDDDEEDHVARQSRTSGDSHDNIPQPDDDDFDDDDDDDNKEGDGFEMASDDPETPASVRQQRKAEQDAAKKKKKKKGAARDDESKSKKSKKKKRSKDDSDEGTVPRKKTKKKKFNPYSTTFSPKGNPGPREFTTVPISDMKDVREDDEKGVRRSKRTHIRPLEYWRGERVIYGPNDEFDNDNYDSLVNMPVPKAISRPEPTPYKKPRRPEMKPKVVNDKKKKTQSASTLVSDDMEPFDNSKIRKKYPGMVSDGDEAYLWDEVMEEGTHMSKNWLLIGVCVFLCSPATHSHLLCTCHRGNWIQGCSQGTTSSHGRRAQESRRQGCWFGSASL
jgi:centromere protein C